MWDGGRQNSVAATATAVVDDPGAGDVFASAYAFALTCGAARDRLEVGAIAGMYAAEKVQRMGTAPLPALVEQAFNRLGDGLSHDPPIGG